MSSVKTLRGLGAMTMLVAIITKDELERYKNLLREMGVFGEFHHCNHPRSEEEKAACRTESELFRLKLDEFWVELAVKYGFDNRQPLILDTNTGEIRVVPMSPKTY
jgi:hypothetical protein